MISSVELGTGPGTRGPAVASRAGRAAGGRVDLGVRLCPGQGLPRVHVQEGLPRRVLQGFFFNLSFFRYNTSNSALMSAT